LYDIEHKLLAQTVDIKPFTQARDTTTIPRLTTTYLYYSNTVNTYSACLTGRYTTLLLFDTNTHLPLYTVFRCNTLHTHTRHVVKLNLKTFKTNSSRSTKYSYVLWYRENKQFKYTNNLVDQHETKHI